MTAVVRVYGSLFAGNETAFVAQHKAPDVEWEQARSRFGDAVDASFVLRGAIKTLQNIFYTWLAYHVERGGDGSPWCGFVQEMVLHHHRRSRVRGLDGVYNAIQSKHKGLLYNTGFETNGSGVVFDGWQQSLSGSGTVTAETTAANIASGAQSARFSGFSGTAPTLYQDVAVSPHETYRVSFVTRGNGGDAGSYSVYDVTNSAFIVSTSTGNATTKYKKVTSEFVTPDGCVSVRVYLSGSVTGANVWYDDVELVRIGADGQVLPNYTAWATNDQSITRYGRRELIVDAGDVPPAEAALFRDLRLQKAAWPRTQKPQFGGGGKETWLEIRCVGYWATAFFQYLTQHTNGDVTARSTAVSNIIANDCPWLVAGNIRSNTGNTKLDKNREIRAGEALAQIVGEGDDSNLWRFLVGDRRRCVYEPIPTDPSYFLSGDNYLDRIGARVPLKGYQLQPGVWVRDLDYPAMRTAYDSLQIDSRDFLVDEWAVSADGEIDPVVYEE